LGVCQDEDLYLTGGRLCEFGPMMHLSRHRELHKDS
jgi:hypothetical protein